jgi:Prp8 binding protein
VKPFVKDQDDANRLTSTFYGHSHNFEKNLLKCSWNFDDSMISVGSADRFVYVWDADNGSLLHRLGGH